MIASGGSYYKVMNGNVGSVIKEYDRPYISGHVTDGSSTFTFKINNSTDITVPVNSDGNFKWYVNTSITSLQNAFNEKHNISVIELYGLKDVTSLYNMFRGATSVDYNLEKVIFKNFDFSKITTEYNVFVRRRGLKSLIGFDSMKHSSNINLNSTFQQCYSLEFGNDFKWENVVHENITDLTNCFYDVRSLNNKKIDCSKASTAKLQGTFFNCYVEDVYLPITNVDTNITSIFEGAQNLRNIYAQTIFKDINIRWSQRLTKQSILNIINAAAANVTYTLHSTVYNKCASGGEWYTDVQAAIDAKALEGYTVTLISA